MPPAPGRTTIERLRAAVARLKQDAILLYLAARDPRVPWLPKLLAALTAAYAFSPIDLIPDFIPVLGLLDELILLPGLIWLALRLVPAPLLASLRQKAAVIAARPVSRAGALMIAALWAGALALLAWLAWR